MMPAPIGLRVGRLTVVAEATRSVRPDGKYIRWMIASCDCGTPDHVVRLQCLRRGSTLSCGCRKRERHPAERIARRAASLRRTDEECFWRYASPEPNSGCWLWAGSMDGKGYGQIRRNGRLMYATHLSLLLAGRPLPPGLSALHRCDVPACVNPDHLFHGTHRDNMHDMIAKGRHDWSGLDLGRGRRK